MMFSGNPWSDRLNELAKFDDAWYDGSIPAASDYALKAVDIIISVLNECTEKAGLKPFVFMSLEFSEGGLEIEFMDDTHLDQVVVGISNNPESFFAYRLSFHGQDVTTDVDFETSSISELTEFLFENINSIGNGKSNND